MFCLLQYGSVEIRLPEFKQQFISIKKKKKLILQVDYFKF